MLAAQWTHRLPLLQKCSPAKLAAFKIQDALDQLDQVDGEEGHMELRVVDFCSGGGGMLTFLDLSVLKQSGLPRLPVLHVDC